MKGPDRSSNAAAETAEHPAADASPQAVPPHDAGQTVLPADLHVPHTRTVIVVAVVFLALLGGLFALGWFPHQSREAVARADAAERSADMPIVAVAGPKPAASSADIVLPGDVRANQDTAIYARTSGYLKSLLVDIGDHVKAGQLLAEIDTPEVDAQLAQSQASLAQFSAAVTKAQSDRDLARMTLQRLEDLEKSGTGSVTQQMLDEKRSAVDDATSSLASAKANVLAAKADVQRLTVLQGFEKVVAPFAGTITARNYDLGALLSPNEVGAGKEIFHIVQSKTLRVFVNVPQTYATQIQTGQPAYLTVQNYPGRQFDGTVVRFSGALDTATRTLAFEMHFPNPQGLLYPGMYAQVRLTAVGQQPVLIIPSGALLFNAEGLRVALVREGKIHFQTIAVGRDLGTEMEVTSGLSASDEVVANPGERLAEGVSVDARPVAGSAPAPMKASPVRSASVAAN